MSARDRDSARPAVGPGPIAGALWLSEGVVRGKEDVADFIHRVTPLLGRTIAKVTVPDGAGQGGF
eukprot:13983419-Alexandrium_andersonii.AAC.1